jgi:hypothetical protein
MAVVGSTIVLAHVLCRGEKLAIRHAADGSVLITGRTDRGGTLVEKVTIVFDERVCGSRFGRVLRDESLEWLFDHREVRITEYRPGLRHSEGDDANAVIIVGRAASHAEGFRPDAKRFLIDPLPTRKGFGEFKNDTVVLSPQSVLRPQAIEPGTDSKPSFVNLNGFLDSAEGWNQLARKTLSASGGSGS